MPKKYRVTLTAEERVELEGMLGKGKADARKLAHARILLQADAADGGPARTDEQVAAGLNVSTRTVERVRQRFAEDGLPAALRPKPTKRVHDPLALGSLGTCPRQAAPPAFRVCCRMEMRMGIDLTKRLYFLR